SAVRRQHRPVLRLGPGLSATPIFILGAARRWDVDQPAGLQRDPYLQLDRRKPEHVLDGRLGAAGRWDGIADRVRELRRSELHGNLKLESTGGIGFRAVRPDLG